ncbi:9048_t:CDS:2 [Dentiscutata heterogama]|uniref:9048_t:CDS:1 n=1 Tax=Dentiscutata heterogama TaxID=1316150 RepID=A0ACA9KMM3_9GLOM|nr:9048_t:CDS:2 [Dentiscutata heterogama]
MALSKYKFIAFIICESFKANDRNKVNIVQQESQLSTRMRKFTQKNYLNDPKKFKAFCGKNNGKTDRSNNMSSLKHVVHKVNFVQQESKALYIKKIDKNIVNAKEFSHNLRLEHKCLVNEVKEYEKNAEIFNVASENRPYNLKISDKC